ncbi:MAG TPA: PQQ-dependent sugar dehydrogenase [Pyrinomonadaceae bacterium]|jgi:glucose/arabinose dehydrogenase|nr:PQQ-dependent sugar dehydrogenase [Pyrinomonadaceae bacterium]
MKIKVFVILPFLIACSLNAARVEGDRAQARTALRGVRNAVDAPPLRTSIESDTSIKSYAEPRSSSNSSSSGALRLTPRRISLADGKRFDLNLPEGFDIKVAAEGLKRVRFMARSPDKRVFVTDMYNLTDNRRGAVYILDDFDAQRGKFGKVTRYLARLRNPNSIAFYTDRDGVNWLYLALTDRLVRYRYTSGDDAPQSAPQVIATFPDYGLGYKYGGWHLTRTVAVGPNEKIYVSVGSSCNACEEKEEIRATVIELEPDGRHQRIFAKGLRNAVGIKWVDGKLFATNMGADHLGRDRPQDTMYEVKEGTNYGWPYCFRYRSINYSDPQFAKSAGRLNCRSVPPPYAAFPAHSSPLGLEYFGSDTRLQGLRNSFLVALHGSSDHRMNRGHQIVQVKEDGATQAFVSGFVQNGRLYGRPADVMQLDADSLLFTDDHTGVVYYVSRGRAAAR